MSYKNASEILPSHLLQEIQKYIEGGLIYIPKNGKKTAWGYLSGARKIIDNRNKEITRLYENNATIEEIASRFFLSEETIKKIVYGNK